MDEQPYITRWIQEYLAADEAIATLVGTKIYVHEAPQGVARPWIIVSPVEMFDIRVVGMTRIWVRGRWMVKTLGRVVDDDPPVGTLIAIMNAVDNRLQGATDYSREDIEILSSTRVLTGNYPDDSNYENYFQTYEIQGKGLL